MSVIYTGSSLRIVRILAINLDLSKLPFGDPQILAFLRRSSGHYAIQRPSANGWLMNYMTTCGGRLPKKLETLVTTCGGHLPGRFEIKLGTKVESLVVNSHWLSGTNLMGQSKPQCLITPAVHWPEHSLFLRKVTEREPLEFLEVHGSTIEKLFVDYPEVLDLLPLLTSAV